MLDIDKLWFTVLVVNFFVLIYILNKILYTPILRIFSERESTVRDSLDKAREMEKRKDEGIAALKKEMADAKARAKEAFETLKAEGLESQRNVLSEAESAAADMLQKARGEIRGEVEKARQKLRADVEQFSEEIVRKLVKA